MDFRSFIEAIDTPPHLPRQYYEKHLEALNYIGDLFKRKIDTYNFFKQMRDFTSHPWRDVIEDTLNQLDDIRSKLYDWNDRPKSLEWLKYALDEKDVERSMKYLKLVVEDSANLEETLSKVQVKEATDAFNKLKDSMEEQKADWNVEYYGEFDEQMKMIEYIKRLLSAVSKMQSWYPAFVKKAKATLNLFNREATKFYSGGGKTDKPQTENIETLYHATTCVSCVVKEGFKTREELGKGSLGGGPSDVISFTADQQVAEAIVWAIRRAAEIAQNKLNIRQLALLAKHLGDEFAKSVKYVISSGGGSYQTKNAYDNDSFFPKKRERNPDEKRQWLFQAFRHAITTQKKVYDPLFFGVTIKDFEQININDVGVVAAEVDMSQVADYLPSMEEYRVPPKAIRRVWKVSYRGVFNPVVKYQ